MRHNRFNISTGVVEFTFPMTLTLEDVQDIKDAMAITFRVMERIATNGQRQEGETTSEPSIAKLPTAGNVRFAQ